MMVNDKVRQQEARFKKVRELHELGDEEAFGFGKTWLFSERLLNGAWSLFGCGEGGGVWCPAARCCCLKGE